MEKTLSIGQVIYVLSNKAQKIVPAIVVEEIQVKKLDGNNISWKIAVGPKNKEKVVDSTRIDGEIYSSLDEIRKILFDRLSGFLDELISDTEKRVENWYGKQPDNQNSDLPISEIGRIDPESLMETIDNNSNTTSNNLRPEPKQTNPQTELRQRMMRELQDDDYNSSGQDMGEEEILMPDGSMIKAKIKSNV